VKKIDNLENNKTDLLVSATKLAVGFIPIAGSLLSEFVVNIIPNQRIDRLSKFVKELEVRISNLSTDKIKSLLNNDDFIDLIEEGFIQASRAITDKRREYIASIVSNGITDENIQLNESKQLLKILTELNDTEIIWLRYYLFPAIGGDDQFRKKHKNILQPIHNYIGADDEAMNKAAIQNSFKDHLERLKLIDHRIQIDNKSKMPEYDSVTGKPKILYSAITPLGRLLLKQIGIINDLNLR
jgi:hypothetical protein